jgi:fucose permease
MECIDAIGSFVGPLLAQPFLARKTTNPHEEVESYLNESSSYQSHINKILTSSLIIANDDRAHDVFVNNNTANLSVVNNILNTSHFNADWSGYTSVMNKTNLIINTTQGTSQVAYAYVIVGVLLMLVAIAHFVMFGQEKCQIHFSDDSTSCQSKRIAYRECPEERKIRLLILPLLFLICFAYYALETGYAHYLMTFCVKYLKWSKDDGVIVTSVFWSAYTAGTVVGIVIIKYVRPRTMLAFDVTLCVTSQVTLACFLTYHPAVVWVCTAAAGVSIATIFASVFSWTQKNIGVSGKVNALLMVGMATGEMTSPAIIGILIDKSGAISWVYCMVAASVLCATSFIIMHILANKRKSIRRDVTSDHSSSPCLSETMQSIKIQINKNETGELTV